MTNEPSLSPRKLLQSVSPPLAVATTTAPIGLQINTEQSDSTTSSQSNSPSSPRSSSSKMISPGKQSKEQSASVSPIGSDNNDSQTLLKQNVNSLKRNRDSSLENSSLSSAVESDLDRRNLSTSSSPQPPTKTAKTSAYSIMNILGKESNKTLNKENSEDSRPHTPTSQAMNLFNNQPDFALLQQHLMANNGSNMNPFMMNPFLAAAAALNQNQQSSGQQTTSLLNNISNLAMLSNLNGSNKQQQSQAENFWPWLNMAAMSALYNAGGTSNVDSKFEKHMFCNLILNCFI